MAGNPLIELQRSGQSVWLDQMRRALLTGGALAGMIRDGVRGPTSKLTIFGQHRALGDFICLARALRCPVASAAILQET